MLKVNQDRAGAVDASDSSDDAANIHRLEIRDYFE